MVPSLAMAAPAAVVSSSSSLLRRTHTYHVDAAINTIAPYTYGLTGVNVPLDDQASSALYISIGIVLLAILFVRLFQRGNAHLRHMITVSAGPQEQRFWQQDHSTWWPWMKRHVVYAPLFGKRHNHEIQLSSTVSMGTLPSRMTALLLSAYAFSNLVYCLSLNYDDPNAAARTAEFRGRTGHLAVMNLIALFILAGRNNPLIRILRVSFDSLNMFHRWIGRIVVVESIAHTAAWAANESSAFGWSSLSDKLSNDAFCQYGLAGTIAVAIILIQSPSTIRHAFYETFLALHQILALIALIGILGHCNLGHLPQTGFAVLVLFIWLYDRIMRVIRLICFNYSRRLGTTKCTVQPINSNACLVTFYLPRKFNPPPGSHIYAYIPAISAWQSHPFSVAWTTQNDSQSKRDVESGTMNEQARSPILDTHVSTCSLVVSARSGMTRQLLDAATTHLAKGKKTLTLSAAIEGPYGALESLHSYGTVVLFAGGIGITHMTMHIRDLLECHNAGSAPVQRITLIWSIRSPQDVEWIRRFMDEIMLMPSRFCAFNTRIFVTRPRKDEVIGDLSERLTMTTGRPPFETIIETEFKQRVGAMSVGVCGPGVFADEVRFAARKFVERGKVDFWEEGFTW